jgi:hypothetical protein
MYLQAFDMTRDEEAELTRRRDALMSTPLRPARPQPPPPEAELQRRRDALMATRLRPSQPQPSTAVPKDRVRRLFHRAMGDYRARRYRRAIIAWEQVRHLSGMAPNVAAACLYNIAAANLKLRRFATALIYLETYIASPAISDRDRRDARARLSATKRRLGMSAP